MMPPPRRKKWTEAEERTLIEKYGAMICDGSLSKMKTREKKYKPIAFHVNSVHHHSDPVVYPWEWSWKDVSNKVQNMRHQYSLVKQKIKLPKLGGGEGFQWVEGLTHWSNFLRYKEVFGDVTVPFGNENSNGNQGNEEIVEFGNVSGGGGDYENGVMGLEFDYDGGEREENYVNEDGNHVFREIETMGSETRKKRKKMSKKAWGFVANQLGQLREMEARFEQREDERERERDRRESVRVKNEEEREKQREKVMERLKEERKRRKDEEIKWEERIIQRRIEWKGKIDEMLNEHRHEMGQIQSRILHEQQNLTNQLLAVVSQWSGHQSGIQDNTNGGYISQMMQHVGVSGMVDVDVDAQVEEHNQDDQFIVDG